MFGHGFELLIILVIGLIVFGPEKLPEVAMNVGKIVRELRGAMDDVMHPEMEPEHYREPEDFSTYYYESLARSGETVAEPENVEEGTSEEDHVASDQRGAPAAEEDMVPLGLQPGDTSSPQGEERGEPDHVEPLPPADDRSSHPPAS